ETIAAAINGWRGGDSLVIALYGPWGSGKSSIKNMIVEALNGHGQPRALVAEFNPWQFANRDQLTEAFFDQIGIALGRGTLASQKRRRELLLRWRRYAAYLQRSGRLILSTRGLMPWVLLVGGLGSIGVAVIGTRIIGACAGALLVVAALAEWVGGFVSRA